MPKKIQNRDKTKEIFWRKTIARQLESRLTQAAFCEEERINQNNFSWWKKEISRRDAEVRAEKPSPAFVEVSAVTEAKTKYPDHNHAAVAEIDLAAQVVRIFGILTGTRYTKSWQRLENLYCDRHHYSCKNLSVHSGH